jgi:hypothetical protein
MDADSSHRRDRLALREGAGRAPARSHFRALEALAPREPRFTHGVYARYAAEVGPASQGAVLVPPQLVAQPR